MQIDLNHMLFLASGFVAGGFVVWLRMRGQIALAEANGLAEGQVERTALAEQLKAAHDDVMDFAQRLKVADERGRSLQADIERVMREAAQLGERASRLEIVEAKLVEVERASVDLGIQIASAREIIGSLTADNQAKGKRQIELENDFSTASADREALQLELSKLMVRIAELESAIQSERQQSVEKLGLLAEARENLSNQFKALASEILEEKSKKFTEQNQENLGQLLGPLKERLNTFQAKVEEVYVSESKDRSALMEQVKMLTLLNNTLSQDTQNLTLALKGDRKAQGNWGEIILDDVLEKAGLFPGQHYDRQASVKTEDGQSHVIPDVVIRLPADRNLVVDSKMTLPDYRAFVDADSDVERDAALKRHLLSIRSHIKGLSEKNYQTLYGLKSLDFVVMFVPLEPAFMLSVTNDKELFQHAWDKNVLLVSPSTLLFVVRTVAYLWRQEGLSRNAKEISSRGAELYDKLVGFVTDLQKVGDRLQQAQDSYQEARRKFSEGNGNVIRQAHLLKSLGVKPSKSIPDQWINASLPDDSPADEENSLPTSVPLSSAGSSSEIVE